MLISLLEIIYLLITTAVVGYIFMDLIPKTRIVPLSHEFDWETFKLACLVAAPGIVFHELGHKFVAMAYGLSASFSVWAFGLFLGIFLKAIGSPFILLAPGYVGIGGSPTVIQETFISFAGPAVNLIFWLGSWFILDRSKKLTRKQAVILYLTKVVNMWLFIFNMLPIPPLDGFKVFYGLYKLIF